MQNRSEFIGFHFPFWRQANPRLLFSIYVDFYEPFSISYGIYCRRFQQMSSLYKALKKQSVPRRSVNSINIVSWFTGEKRPFQFKTQFMVAVFAQFNLLGLIDCHFAISSSTKFKTFWCSCCKLLLSCRRQSHYRNANHSRTSRDVWSMNSGQCPNNEHIPTLNASRGTRIWAERTLIILMFQFHKFCE